ncbi:MAG: DNA topoisomerase 1 [Firmicutes bacterium ADurb.Bin356]|nr:MAG: DNA topoisomerase 1 [Firmicutes bacterium ADurb.Bin356]
MADTLVIVESPAKAKTIEKFLGKNYKVVASNGHVRDLPKSQLGVDTENGFKPKYITLRGRGDVLDKIRREAKNAEKVFLATDPDREGEAIAWHLASVLKLDENSQCRISFNEITSGAVKRALTKVRAIDMKLVNAQQARRILDRLVGYKISPVLWAKVRKGLSAGRVQSVATRIICDREQEINEFTPVEYWVISVKLIKPPAKKAFEAKFYGFNGKKADLANKEAADEVLKRLESADYLVTDVKTAPKSRTPAPPFTTSTLQQDASRRLHYSTKKTMMVAQQLYEGIELSGKGATGLITYMRTDSVRIAQSAQAEAAEFIEKNFGKQYVPDKPNVYKGRAGAQDAHEAIRPTSVSNTPAGVKGSLTKEQYSLYKIIYERFLASQMTAARYENTTVSVDANGATFRAVGVRTLFDGFTAVYTETHDEATESEVALPPIEVGDKLVHKNTESEQRFTQPPSRYTEASLVRTLEEKGIGRPSTYSPTISTILERGYVSREKRVLYPTELGFLVTQLMKDNFKDIVDLAFTADMEEQLDRIEEGEAESESVLKHFYGPFIKTVEEASENIEKVEIPDEVSDTQCEKCGAMMVYKVGRYGRFLACPNYPACKNTKPILEKIDVPCPECGGALIKRKTKRGKVFYGCENYPSCSFVSWDKPLNERCEKCGSLMVKKTGRNGSFTICSNKECGNTPRNAKEQKDAE